MPENSKQTQKTRRLLHSALISLCREKQYQNISIAEICQRAGVYRSTFYRYYQSKDHLLHDIENSYIQDTRDITSGISGFSLLDSPDCLPIYHAELTRDLEYHQANRKISSFLLSPVGSCRFSQKMEDSIARSYRTHLAKRKVTLGPDQDYITGFFASGFVSCIRTWLSRDDLSSAEMAEFLTNMIYIFSV